MRGSKDMSEPKSFASLSSSLLARKGQARPSIRPQLNTTSSTLEDLGWTDMGFDPAPEVPEPAEPVQAAPEENPGGKAQNSIAEAFSPAPALSSGMVRKQDVRLWRWLFEFEQQDPQALPGMTSCLSVLPLSRARRRDTSFFEPMRVSVNDFV